MPKPNTMDLNEFTTSGLLQEVNRRFFHPLGLALYVTKDEKTGQVLGIGGIIDNRSDPAGMVFDSLAADHLKRYQNVEPEFARRIAVRQNLLGYGIQPIPGMDDEQPDNPDEPVIAIE